MAKAVASKTTVKSTGAKKPATKKSATKKPATKKPAAASVAAFLAGLEPDRATECTELTAMMRDATGAEPKMWGPAIVGFGDWHYEYDSGRAGDFFQVGFSPRKAALTIYIVRGYENHGALLAKLGKHTLGKSCLYIKRLEDVDRTVLRELIGRGVAEVVAGAKG